MGVDFIIIIVVCIIGLVVYGGFETKKKYELKEKEIELEKEKVILEQKRLEVKENIDE